MPKLPLDPAPRIYPPWVTLLRRSAVGPAAAPERTTIEEVEAWLLGEAMDEKDLLPLFESLIWRMIAAGLQLERVSLHIGTLHPQVIGFAWNWNRTDGLCDEVQVPQASQQTDSYKLNPLFRVIEHGEVFRADTGDPAIRRDVPLMAELAEQDITDYMAMPIGGDATYHNAATAATKQPGGFTDEDLASWTRVLRLLALHVERHIMWRIAGNVLDTYLGSAAGAQVLSGSIMRGSGEPIRAVIWVSDMRGFTDLTDRLAGPDVIAILNAYFEHLAGAVMAHDGEVLKFIGDGLLAVFPFSAFDNSKAAAEAAFAAAQEALSALERVNREPPGALAEVDGWRPLRTGIALHEGEVFFGNVGAPERLDFTVIGRAVNEASRVEALTKTLGRPILITEPVARLVGRPLEDLGRHPLRGLAEPVSIFAPRELS